jgi:hypothetical protein
MGRAGRLVIGSASMSARRPITLPEVVLRPWISPTTPDADTAHHLVAAKGAQLFRHQCRCARQIIHQLRMAMQIVAPFGD